MIYETSFIKLIFDTFTAVDGVKSPNNLLHITIF